MYNFITVSGGGGEGDDPTPITSEQMKKWNKFIDFAKEKGYAGMPDLDHNPDLRKRVFEEYNKANPKDAIDIAIVKSVQNEIQKYKQQALDSIKAHPETYSGTPDTFMKGISKVDGIFGQRTSQWKFPSAYIVNKSTGEKKQIGLAVPYTEVVAKSK